MRLPTQEDIAVAPELALMGVLVVSLQAVIDMLEVAYAPIKYPALFDEVVAESIVQEASVLRETIETFIAFAIENHDP